MEHAKIPVVLGLLVCLAGCGGETGGDAPPAGSERTVIGDTTVVRAIGSGLWGEGIELVEETSIGVLNGPDEYQFGFVSNIAVDNQGGIYVFDGQAPALRYYNADGVYVRTVGGQGEGPGEYQDAALGLAVRRSDGRVVMRDPRNMRMNVFESDGSHSDSWRVESNLFSGDATRLDASDHMYLKILTGRPEQNMPWPIALLHLDDRGEIVDTLIPPALPDEPQSSSGMFGTTKVWSFSPLGGFVVGISDRYTFDHYRKDGTVLRMTRDIPRVTLQPEEKREFDDMNAWRQRTLSQSSTTTVLPPVPNVKPVYRSIEVGEDGRFWVRRYVDAERGDPRQGAAQPGMEAPPAMSWREPIVYDVFEPEGDFLGSVVVPAGTSLSVFRGDRVWGVRRGDFDEQYVVAFRISHN